MASWCVTRTLRRTYLNANRINTSRNGIHVSEVSSLSTYSNQFGNKSDYTHKARRKLLYSKGLCSFVHNASYGNQVDEDLNRILNSHTIERVFENLFLNETLSLQLVTAAFTTLDALLTKLLCSFSWALHNRYTIIHIQSHFNSETLYLFKQVNDNSEFKRLCSDAVKFRQDFTNGELLAVTQSLLKLVHININDPNFLSLFIECQMRQDEYDLDELSTYSNIANLMRRNGFHLSAFISGRFQKLRSQLGQTLDEEDLKNIDNLVHQVGYFMTGEEKNEFQESLFEWATNLEEMTFSRFLMIIESVGRFANSLKPELLTLMYDRFEDNFEKVTAEELYRVRLFIKDYNSCKPAVLKKMKERADQLLSQSENLKAYEVIFLTSVYDCLRYPGDSFRVLEDLLVIKTEGMDIILLKYLSLTSIMTLTKRKDVLDAYLNLISKRRIEILGSISCIMSIVNCLSKIPKNRRNQSLDQRFSRQLMFLFLNRQIGTIYLISIARFLTHCLEFFDTQTIECFHDKLLNIIPNISLHDILFIASTLPSQVRRYDYTPSFSKYQPEHYPAVVIKNLAQQAMFRKDELKNLMQVNMWVSVLDKSNSFFIQENALQVCEMYARHAATLDSISIKYANKFLKRFRLHVPQVLDRISSTLLSSPSFFNLLDVTKSLELLAYFNHNCNDIEQVCELYLDKISELGNEWERFVEPIVAGANHLASLQNFSEKLLSFIFSLDFLKQLDETIADSSNSNRIYLKTMFLELNRSVLLQCPHFPVPWIAQSLIWKNFKLYEFITKSWQIAIYEGLLHLLGGVSYVKVGPLTTPHGHLYDYECALDINCIPVPVDSCETHYRIAVLLLKPNNYSSNDNKLSGTAINFITQLEILGFTVIKVPYFDLQKLETKDRQSKMNYFENLLFSKETMENNSI